MPSCSILFAGTGRERSANTEHAGKQGSNLQSLSHLNPAGSGPWAHTEHCETFNRHHGHELPADLQSLNSDSAQRQHLNTKCEQQREHGGSLWPGSTDTAVLTSSSSTAEPQGRMRPGPVGAEQHPGARPAHTLRAPGPASPPALPPPPHLRERVAPVPTGS